jgi:hypothetical protein
MYDEDAGVAVLGLAIAGGAGISGSLLASVLVATSVGLIAGIRWWYAR